MMLFWGTSSPLPTQRAGWPVCGSGMQALEGKYERWRHWGNFRIRVAAVATLQQLAAAVAVRDFLES